MQAIRKLVVANGTYVDGNGDEKTRWLTIGTLLKGDGDKLSIKLDSIPLGNEWNGWVQCFKMEDEHAQPRGRGNGRKTVPANELPDDDIPW